MKNGGLSTPASAYPADQHPAAEIGVDFKQGEFFGADVVAGHQPDASEYALVTGYDLEPVA